MANSYTNTKSKKSNLYYNFIYFFTYKMNVIRHKYAHACSQKNKGNDKSGH